MMIRMKPVIRNIFAVVAGIVTGGAVSMDYLAGSQGVGRK